MSGFDILGGLLNSASDEIVDSEARGIGNFYVLFFIAVIALLIWVSLPGEYRHLSVTKTEKDDVYISIDGVPYENWKDNKIMIDVKEGQNIVIEYNGNEWEFTPTGFYYKNIVVTINDSSIMRELK